MKPQAEPGEHGGRRKRGLQGLPLYDCMDDDALLTMPVKEIAARDSVLFLWATYPKLPEAFAVMDAWGFSFKSVAFTWVKQNPRGVGFHVGLGYWTRGNPELCLLGTRGQPRRLEKDVPNLLVARRREHSRKPGEVYRRIERLVSGPYCELFCRPPLRPGWTHWGEEVPGGVMVGEAAPGGGVTPAQLPLALEENNLR